MSQSAGSEVEGQLDLAVIRYSRVEEDCRILSEALQINPEHDVLLSITSSGDNLLSLLLERPKRIVAIDFSPAQNFLLELKIAAIQHLQYEEYLQLLGEANCSSETRMNVYNKLEKHLTSNVQKYWKSKLQMLREGLSECGRFQKFMSTIHKELQGQVPRDSLVKFFEAKDLDEQRTLFEQLPLDTIRGVIAKKVRDQVAGRSEAQMKYVTMMLEDRVDTIWKHFCYVCRNVAIDDNHYTCLHLTGKRSVLEPVPQQCLPPYLTEEGFTKLKDLVDRIEIVTSSIEEYISSTATEINKMNLSDLFEYMDEKDSQELFKKLSAKMAPGGRMAFWHLYNDRLPSPDSSLKVLPKLSEDLYLQDRVWFYKAFYVCELSP